MIHDLKPYPAMKDSGVPWLGEVPEHWEVKRGKALFRCIDVRSSTGDEELLTVSSERGVVPRSSATVTMFKADSYIGYKLCWPGDLVINSLWAWGRGLGVSQHHGIVSSAYGVYRLRPRFAEYAAYIHQLVRSTPFNWELQVRSKGIWISRLQLTDEAFLGAPFPLPPPDEQTAIVRFLDHADRRIRRYIRAKQKLIKLLEEQKQAIIHRAVTRGLDPNVRLKPSGVEWLGDVPEHWEVAHLRYLVRCLDGQRVPLNAVERGAMQGAYPYWGANRVIDHVNRWLFDEPLVLLGEDGAPFFERGRDVAFAVSGKIWVNNHAHVLRCGNRIVPEFLAQALNCVDYTGFIDGSTRDKLTQQAMGSIPIQIPPIPEQRMIVDRLAASTVALRSAIVHAEREVGLLGEYRTRLIADVVTGKLDVREAAARLPDEAEEPEPVDQIEAEGDADEAGADETDQVPAEAEA